MDGLYVLSSQRRQQPGASRQVHHAQFHASMQVPNQRGEKSITLSLFLLSSPHIVHLSGNVHRHTQYISPTKLTYSFSPVQPTMSNSELSYIMISPSPSLSSLRTGVERSDPKLAVLLPQSPTVSSEDSSVRSSLDSRSGDTSSCVFFCPFFAVWGKKRAVEPHLSLEPLLFAFERLTKRSFRLPSVLMTGRPQARLPH